MGENKASLCTVFLHFLVLLLCFTLLTFCFLFSPPWLEVYDLLSGPNLLKAFNKQTVLEKKKSLVLIEVHESPYF